MHSSSIRRHIHQEYDIWVRTDRDARCPRCNREAFRLAQSEHTAICRACGYRVLPPDPLCGDALSNFLNDSHDALLAPGCGIAKQLIEEGGVHPTVLAQAMVGIVPAGADVQDYFAPEIVLAQQDAAFEENSKKKRGRPKDDGAPSAAERLEGLEELAAALANKVIGKSNALLVFYQDENRRIASINVIEPSGRDEWFSRGIGTGVFGLDLDGIPPPAPDAPEDPTLWCANHNDALRIQSAGARAAQLQGRPHESGYYPVLALARHYPDVDTARAVSRPVPVVCTGPTGFSDYAFARLNERANLKGASVHFLEVAAKAHSLRELRRIVAAAELRPRPLAGVRTECDAPRVDTELKQFEIDRAVADIIERDFGERGRYLFDTREGYLHLHTEKTLVRIDPEDHRLENLLHGCGLAKTDAAFKAAVARLQLYAREHGKRTNVYTSSHWDQERQSLYVYDFDKSIYQISGDKIARVDNGTDGVLFVSQAGATPFDPSWFDPKDSSLLEHHLFGSVNFERSRLSVEDQRLLSRIFFYATFFPELLPTRPILAACGPAGSGKTLMLRLMGQAKFGPAFQVSPLSKDSKDVDAALTNSSFVVLDNADTPVSWLEDRLATAATAGSIRVRKLYTTNTQVEYPITAFVAITSRTPHFRREDVADRLVLLRLERRKGAFVPEHQLIENLARDRDALMAEVFRDLQCIVKQIRIDEGYVYTQDYRMADFAQFAVLVGRALNCVDKVARALEHLDEQRTDFATEHDALIELLTFWVESGSDVGTPLTAGQLYTRLEKCANREELPFRIGDSSALGHELNKRWSTVEKLFGAERHRGSGRRVFYTFPPLPKTETATAPRELREPDPRPASELPVVDDPDLGTGLSNAVPGPLNPDDVAA